jgi:ribosomal protein S18 acetylase RimI-like enzyme
MGYQWYGRRRVQSHAVIIRLISNSKVIDGGITIRLATVEDVPFVRCCNHACLPEHYENDYINMNLSLWPNLFFLAEKEVTRQEKSSLGDWTVPVTETRLLGYIMGKVVARRSIDSDEVFYRVPAAPEIMDEASLKVQQQLYHEHQARAHSFTRSPPSAVQRALSGLGLGADESGVGSGRAPVDSGAHMVGFVTSTAVYPAYRGRGIASHLMRCLHEELLRSGAASEVLLHCRVRPLLHLLFLSVFSCLCSPVASAVRILRCRQTTTRPPCPCTARPSATLWRSCCAATTATARTATYCARLSSAAIIDSSCILFCIIL